jgi:hypothetical protein
MAFEIYVEKAISETRGARPADPASARQHPLLNGAPYQAFRQSVDLADRRAAGAFFSGPSIAKTLAQSLAAELTPDAVVMDPTCGLGDLLLAYAEYLPMASSLSATLALWGQHLAGMDLDADLVRMAKVRLVMLAKARGAFDGLVEEIDDIFPLISVGDALTDIERLKAADGFLFNPPFGQTKPVTTPDWAAGQINAAALFLEALIGSAHPRVKPIAAVLPEVLRSGSRYVRFRAHLESIGVTGAFKSEGRFDAWTDVDVFTTLLKARPGADLWRDLIADATDTVGARFHIKVGTVVPHRHALKGEARPYLCAKTTPAWDEDFIAHAERAYSGTVFKPPFVVIRRTSSPSDRSRAVGTLIQGMEPVAVENHLIVATPREGGVKACRDLLKVLRAPETSDYLNRVMRCRHLTTGTVAAIPWRACDD